LAVAVAVVVLSLTNLDQVCRNDNDDILLSLFCCLYFISNVVVDGVDGVVGVGYLVWVEVGQLQKKGNKLPVFRRSTFFFFFGYVHSSSLSSSSTTTK
jgi:hypothetical protein